MIDHADEFINHYKFHVYCITKMFKFMSLWLSRRENGQVEVIPCRRE